MQSGKECSCRKWQQAEALIFLGNDGRCSIIGNEIGFNNLGATGNTSTHGNEASFETVVAKNPEYIFVMDRDSAISTAGAKTAKEIVENELVKTTDAYKKQPYNISWTFKCMVHSRRWNTGIRHNAYRPWKRLKINSWNK